MSQEVPGGQEGVEPPQPPHWLLVHPPSSSCSSKETGPRCGQCTQTLSWSALGVGTRSPLPGWTVEGGTPAYAGGTRLQTSISTVLSMRGSMAVSTVPFCSPCPSIMGGLFQLKRSFRVTEDLSGNHTHFPGAPCTHILLQCICFSPCASINPLPGVHS